MKFLEELQKWSNDNGVVMNEIDFKYAFDVYSKLGHFDFSIEKSLNKNLMCDKDWKDFE